jgi:hypothetical protein
MRIRIQPEILADPDSDEDLDADPDPAQARVNQTPVYLNFKNMKNFSQGDNRPLFFGKHEKIRYSYIYIIYCRNTSSNNC